MGHTSSSSTSSWGKRAKSKPIFAPREDDAFSHLRSQTSHTSPQSRIITKTRTPVAAAAVTQNSTATTQSSSYHLPSPPLCNSSCGAFTSTSFCNLMQHLILATMSLRIAQPLYRCVLPPSLREEESLGSVDGSLTMCLAGTAVPGPI